MLSTPLFWIDGPWPGRLAVAARPRGGDWLEDEMGAWKHEGVDTVLSLLTAEEADQLQLDNESEMAKGRGIRFLSFPIEDRQVPGSPSELAKTLELVDRALLDGNDVVVHCRQGVGRSGLVGACLLVSRGIDAKSAIDRISTARGIAVPETAEQRQWIDFFAGSFAGSK
jgi:protein-tyrosine phosphatase